MPKLIDITGQKFNYLTVLERDGTINKKLLGNVNVIVEKSLLQKETL